LRTSSEPAMTWYELFLKALAGHGQNNEQRRNA